LAGLKPLPKLLLAGLKPLPKLLLAGLKKYLYSLKNGIEQEAEISQKNTTFAQSKPKTTYT
jgi:hypothetical protein